jgi:Cytochrome C oxidase, cbb3-type, subunit III
MKNSNLIIKILLIGFTTTTLFSCGGNDNTGYEYSPNMYYSQAYEPQTQIAKNTINAGGSNMRTPVKGTLARRNFNTSFVQDDSTVITDLMAYDISKDNIVAAEGLANPIPWSEANEDAGKVLYERNCLHCHGEKGAGDGKVGIVYKGVPNYAADAYKNLTSGHIYHVITHGKGRMWSHSSQILPEERWKIVHYIHRLQLGS